MDKMIKGKTWILKIVGCTYEFLMVLVGHVVFQCPTCKNNFIISKKKLLKMERKDVKHVGILGYIHTETSIKVNCPKCCDVVSIIDECIIKRIGPIWYLSQLLRS